MTMVAFPHLKRFKKGINGTFADRKSSPKQTFLPQDDDAQPLI